MTASYFSDPFPRKQTVGVKVGDVMVGAGHPVVVQSMTNTDTADIDGTVAQVSALARAGSELVRITVDQSHAVRMLMNMSCKISETLCCVFCPP